MTVVAACQLGLTVGEVEANRAAAAAAVGRAAGHGAELVVLPELCDSGYVFSGVAEARPVGTLPWNWLCWAESAEANRSPRPKATR